MGTEQASEAMAKAENARLIRMLNTSLVVTIASIVVMTIVTAAWGVSCGFTAGFMTAGILVRLNLHKGELIWGGYVIGTFFVLGLVLSITGEVEVWRDGLGLAFALIACHLMD